MRRLIASITLVLVGLSVSAYADELSFPRAELRADAHKQQRDVPTDEGGIPVGPVSDAPCVDGLSAGTFACDGVDLLSFLPTSEFGGSDPEGADVIGGGTSDLWGWVDPENGDEYVILGKTNGSAIFRVTDPTAPVFLGELKNDSPAQLIWFDIKVYKDHAFIISESGAHGMDVFDLTRLRGVDEPQDWTVDTTYRTTFSVHNLAINEDTGFAYLVGGNNGIFVPDQCRSGLNMVNIQDPTNPRFAGCHSTGEGGGPSGLASYVHDTQCVVYRGPDEDYTDRELCFNSSEDHMSIVDVTDKLLPEQVALVEYPDTSYAHQGWLTEDFTHFMMGDEIDELDAMENEQPIKTRTIVFDVTDIDAAEFVGVHEGETGAIDHNMYVKDGLVYQSNYAAGLRVLDVADVANANLPQVAFFDSFPAHDDPEFVGTWSNYPYFPSGTIAMSGIDEGLFLLKLQDDTTAEPTTPIEVRNLEAACPPDRVPANSQTDDDENFHEQAIECMVWWEIAKGVSDSEYEPLVEVRREQMASFVARLVQEGGAELPQDAPDAFSDDGTSFHHDNINKLAAAGLVDGTGEGEFSPRASVSRAQMAKFIVNAYEFVSDNEIDSSRDYFDDDNGDQLEEFINASAEAGFTAGRNGGYEPREFVLRDQMAAFLSRTLDLLVAEGTTPPHE